MLALTDSQLTLVIDALRALPSEQQRVIFLKLLDQQCRLADEYDAAQERGEVAKHGGHLPKTKILNGNVPPTTADIGLTRKEVHLARQVREC